MDEVGSVGWWRLCRNYSEKKHWSFKPLKLYENFLIDQIQTWRIYRYSICRWTFSIFWCSGNHQDREKVKCEHADSILMKWDTWSCRNRVEIARRKWLKTVVRIVRLISRENLTPVKRKLYSRIEQLLLYRMVYSTNPQNSIFISIYTWTFSHVHAQKTPIFDVHRDRDFLRYMHGYVKEIGRKIAGSMQFYLLYSNMKSNF